MKNIAKRLLAMVGRVLSAIGRVLVINKNQADDAFTTKERQNSGSDLISLPLSTEAVVAISRQEDRDSSDEESPRQDIPIINSTIADSGEALEGGAINPSSAVALVGAEVGRSSGVEEMPSSSWNDSGPQALDDTSLLVTKEIEGASELEEASSVGVGLSEPTTAERSTVDAGEVRIEGPGSTIAMPELQHGEVADLHDAVERLARVEIELQSEVSSVAPAPDLENGDVNGAQENQESPPSIQSGATQTEPVPAVNENSVGGETAGLPADHGSSKPGVPRIPRSRPGEDTAEYVPRLVELSPLPDDYKLWNDAIAQHMLLADQSCEAYLTVTPRTLAHAMDDFRSSDLSPEDAESSFVRATAEMYRIRVLTHSGRLRTLRRLGNNGIPDCVGFLALSVLAAYRMRADEDAAGHAYYVRLANLLGCDFSGSYPQGYDPGVFESLWMFVKSWVEGRTGARLALPRNEESGHYRYVALPLAHVPLRCLDIEKLPAFFSWAGYQPGSTVPVERLESDLLNWERSRSALTPTGVAALGDDRRKAVIAQVESELESWDGSVVESASRRSALVEVMLDVVLRRPALFYLPRRPAGFPEVFQSGSRLFEAADTGWYDPVRVCPEDGCLLVDGFEWQGGNGGAETVLRRSGAQAIAFTPSEYSGFLSHRSLNLGVKCAVLCTEGLAGVAAQYLENVSGRRCPAVTDSELPLGWSLFTNVVPSRSMQVPDGLDGLEIDSTVEIVPSGGLRIGRKWAWLAGASPQVYVMGLEQGHQPTLDGEPLPLSDDGLVQFGSRLSRSGIYILEAGRLRKRIEIIEAQFGTTEQSRDSEVVDHSVVALPAGPWVLIGAVPGEVAYARSDSRSGTLAKSSFVPVWAVQVGAGRGARVARLSCVEPRVRRGNGSLDPVRRRTRRLELWVDAIYSAQVRRPSFVRVSTTGSDESTLNLWRQYVLYARELKRLFKRH